MFYTQGDIVNKIIPVLKRYPVKRGALFGSYARNEQNENSDVDLLLDLGINATHSTIDYVYDLLVVLENSLNIPVDFITVRSLNTNPSESFKKKIEKESRWFYEV